MKAIWQLVARRSRFVLGALAVAGLILALISAGSSIEDIRRVGPTTGAAALVLMMLAVLGVGAIWALLVSWLSPNSVWRGGLVRSFLLSWPARYVPGTIPYHAGRVLAAKEMGTTRSAVLAAIGYEAILQIGAAALLGVVAILVAIGIEKSASSLYFLVLTPLVVLPVLLQPSVLLPGANLVLRLARRQTLSSASVLGSAQTTQALLGYAGVYALNGLAFWCVLNAVTDTNPNVLLALGAYSLGGAAGVLVLFVPSGMGVREAVIVAVMSTAHPADSVLLAAGLARALSVIGDLLPLALIACVDAAGRFVRLLGRVDSSVTN